MQPGVSPPGMSMSYAVLIAKGFQFNHNILNQNSVSLEGTPSRSESLPLLGILKTQKLPLEKNKWVKRQKFILYMLIWHVNKYSKIESEFTGDSCHKINHNWFQLYHN